MDLKFVVILIIFVGTVGVVFLHCLDRFLLRRNLKRVCKSQELPVRKCSPRNCEPLLESYFPTTPNMICGYIPPPSDEHEYGYIPPPPSYLAQSSAPTNNTPPPPRSSEHDLPQNGYLPQSSGLTNTPASFLDWASGGAPPRSNEHQYSCLFSSPRESAKPLSRRDLRGPPPPHFSDPVSSEPADILPKSDSYKVGCDRETEKFRESLKTMGSLPFQDPSNNLIRPDPFSPMSQLPMDKEYLNKLSAIAVNINKFSVVAVKEFLATAGIGATATSMTGRNSAHVIGMDESMDSPAVQPTREALMNNLL